MNPRRFSALRVTQDGRTDHLLAEGNTAMDAYHTALRLRDYLLRKSSSTGRFVQAIPAAMAITPDEFWECADGLRQGTGRMKAVLDIDLDQGRFSALDAVGCQDVYAIRDVCVAARHASQQDCLQWEQRLGIFIKYLEPRAIRCEESQVGPPVGPAM